jgi:hypothetical protein
VYESCSKRRTRIYTEDVGVCFPRYDVILIQHDSNRRCSGTAISANLRHFARSVQDTGIGATAAEQRYRVVMYFSTRILSSVFTAQSRYVVLFIMSIGIPFNFVPGLLPEVSRLLPLITTWLIGLSSRSVQNVFF